MQNLMLGDRVYVHPNNSGLAGSTTFRFEDQPFAGQICAANHETGGYNVVYTDHYGNQWTAQGIRYFQTPADVPPGFEDPYATDPYHIHRDETPVGDDEAPSEVGDTAETDPTE